MASVSHAYSQHVSFCLESEAREELGVIAVWINPTNTCWARAGKTGVNVGCGGMQVGRDTVACVERRELSGWVMMCVETAEYFKQGLSLSGCNFQTLTLVKELWGL